MGAPGWDDAPIDNVDTASTPHLVSMIYPYYENPLFFAEQLARWKAYPGYVRDMIRVIVVDDGSPNSPAEAVLREHGCPIFLRLFRIEVDVRWNWLAARNIAMKYAADGWCVCTDMDHVITHQVADRLINRAYNPGTIYRFSRVEHTGERIHPHPNSFLITRAMFWKVGGYDEALSGHYGTDGDWRRRCAAAARIRTLRLALERHEYQRDSSTTHYQRKQPEDAGKKAIIARRGPNWRPRTLSFPFHEVTDLPIDD